MGEFMRNEKRSRSLVKGVSWRIIATISTVIIAYLLTGEPTIALKIGAVEMAVKFFLYYFHERAWNRL